MAMKKCRRRRMCMVHPIKIQEYIVFFLERLIKREDDRVPFVGCGGCVGHGPQTLRFYDFSLQILFQEIEIGHL